MGRPPTARTMVGRGFLEIRRVLEGALTQDQFEAIEEQLIEQYQQVLTNPRPNGDEITVPTGSLFIELMPSTNSNIEEFKRKHRIPDVKKVQADVRQARKVSSTSRAYHASTAAT